MNTPNPTFPHGILPTFLALLSILLATALVILTSYILQKRKARRLDPGFSTSPSSLSLWSRVWSRVRRCRAGGVSKKAKEGDEEARIARWDVREGVEVPMPVVLVTRPTVLGGVEFGSREGEGKGEVSCRAE